MTHRLEASGIHVRSAHAHLVRNVSITLDAERPMTIIGETGSGKSLLAEAIMGTLPPELTASGSVTIDGIRHAADDARTRRALWGRGLSMLPQEPWLALDPTMRAGQQVSEVYELIGGQTRESSVRQSQSILKRLGLAGAASKFPHMLSGGMAQRVVFAATRAGNAPILIVDEPTKGLDASLRDGLVALLRQALAEGCALLTITHDLAVARALGGRIAVMLDGEFVETGATDDVLSNPQHAYTRQLIAAEPSHWPTFKVPAIGQSVLRATGISKSFGPRRLFSDTTLDLAAGERVAITGASGSGKTTLGNVLLGLLKPDTGTVARLADGALHRYQKIYQDPPAAFAPRVTMRDALADLGALHGFAVPKSTLLMRRLKLGDHLLDRRPDQISGGELQRFALLRVLLVDPALILADEPTSRLDPITQFETMALLAETAAEQEIALLLVTHDPDIAAKMAGRTVKIGESAPGPESPDVCRS